MTISKAEADAGDALWRRLTVPEKARRKLLNAYRDAVLQTAAPEVTGATSDGFHTFDELYHHRTVLTAMLLNLQPGLDPWKARLHDDGTMFDGFFIVGADTMGGQATYHCRDRYWDLFDIEERERAPVFDGHTPDDTLARLYQQVTGRDLEVKP